MPATELVTVQHQHAAAPRQVRISRAVRIAIDQMVFKALKRPDAAQTAGITDNALYQALRKPAVLAYLDTQQQVLRTSAKARSIARIDNLADDAESEHVKLQSNVFLLGIEGISPVTKTENININKNMQPGMTLNIIVGSAPVDDALLIGSQSQQCDNTKVINALPRPVPHPSMRNALPAPTKTEGLPAKRGGQAKAPRGVK